MLSEQLSYERIKTLLEGIGISFTDNGISNAEISAYASGLGLIAEQYDALFSELFVHSAEGLGLERLEMLLNLEKSGLTVEERRERIIKRLSESFGEFTFEEFKKEFARLGNEVTYYPYQGKITVFGIGNENFRLLEILGDVIEKTIPPFIKVTLSGYGMSFDCWDANGLCFNEYDLLNCSFDILDTIDIGEFTFD